MTPKNYKTEAQDSAFPCEMETAWIGLTKREYFAAMILQGLMANPARYAYIANRMDGDLFDPALTQEEATRKNCHKAVLMADALIDELNDKPETEAGYSADEQPF